MKAALIDLHVRAPEQTVESGEMLSLLRDKGLDAIVLVGNGRPPQMPEGATTSLPVYQGVELDTDIGRLVCFPREADAWFQESGWLTEASAEAALAGAHVIEAFAERGGAVMVAQPYDAELGHPCLEDAFKDVAGLSGVVVCSSPGHKDCNQRALTAATEAHLPAIAGSASEPAGERFGTVATLFPRQPQDQEGLVASIKAGRMWPVEITAKVAVKPTAVSPPEPRKKRKGRKGKDDNRGNRLALDKITRPQNDSSELRQPDFDPIAKLYGLHRRDGRHNEHKSDAELDRTNGNRSSGPDPNVMMMPDFRELQAERQHVNLLLQTIDTQRQQDRDSIALRFAVAALGRDANDDDIDFEALEQAAVDAGRNRKRKRRRR